MSEAGGSVGMVRTHYWTFAQAPDEVMLGCGRSFGPVTVAYETYGTLNAAGDNAILIIHALTGDAHAAGRHRERDKNPGWWDPAIGPGRVFDTDRFFVICSNCLGGCMGTTGPASLNPATGQPYGLAFPVITVHDMVKVQAALVRHLGVRSLACIAGGSLGGMQVLEWAIRYPYLCRSIMPIATTWRLSPQAIAFNEIGRTAIVNDPCFCDGNYYPNAEWPGDGLALARMIGHITYLSEEKMQQKFGRRMVDQYGARLHLKSKFQVENYLQYQGDKFIRRFDANSYLYLTRAMDLYDLEEDWGTLANAFARIRAKVLLMSFTSDWLFPPAHSGRMHSVLQALYKDVVWHNVDTPSGHDSFLVEYPTINPLLRQFINHIDD